MAYVMITPYTIINVGKALLLFIILHLLVYPSSNAYNSLQDQDEGSIGLIKNPLQVDKRLGLVSIILDTLAITLSIFVSVSTAIAVLIYILVSRLYSNRKIRLKQYPVLGFLVVFIFQGAWIFYMVSLSLGDAFVHTLKGYHLWAFSASCLIGAIYPLSQIYQHETDRADGVITISYLLGKKGTFLFSGILFLIGSIAFLLPFYASEGVYGIILYLIFQLPSLVYFNYWFFKVLRDEGEANFKHTMRMSLISATCMNAFFIFIFFFNF